MDFGTILGFVLGFTFIGVAITMHGSLKDFIDVPGALVAFGGSFSAVFINFPLKKVLGVFGVVKNCFLVRLPEPRMSFASCRNCPHSLGATDCWLWKSRSPM